MKAKKEDTLEFLFTFSFDFPKMTSSVYGRNLMTITRKQAAPVTQKMNGETLEVRSDKRKPREDRQNQISWISSGWHNLHKAAKRLWRIFSICEDFEAPEGESEASLIYRLPSFLFSLSPVLSPQSEKERNRERKEKKGREKER